MAGPLQGVKVLELIRVGPGHFCTMMLADMGAEVLKIETPPQLREDSASGFQEGDRKKQQKRLAFNMANRNKRSIAINLRSEEGQRVLQQLAKTADVLVEGFRPGVMERLGGGYDALSQINPRLIYCSLSGYGQNGPYRDMPGHDINYISFAGALDVIGQAGGPPVIPLNFLADYASAALHGVIGILLALCARERLGKGQYVDISYTDGVVSIMGASGMAMNYFVEGLTYKRGEGSLAGAYPYYHVYETKDGKMISLGCLEPYFWERLCQALGREDFLPYGLGPQHTGKPDPKYDEVTAQLKQIFLTRTRDEWFDFLSTKNVCVGKVLTWGEVVEDPQVRYRQMVVELEGGEVGTVKQAGIAVKLSQTPGSIRNLAPALGQHTDEVLNALGYDAQAIAGLRQQGAVA